jgi:hypothetical protein
MKHFKLMKGVLACLLSLALVVTCFTSVGAKADETSGSGTATVTAPTTVSAEFKWATNTVEANSAAVVYVLKAKTGNTIKKGAKSVTLAKASQTATKFSATMADLGIKKATKEVYLYVCDKEFEANGTNISANLVIKAPAAKKVVGTIDYTKADGDDKTFNVISATATDDKKAAIKDPEIWWSTEADGTYYQVNDSAKADTPRKYADSKTDAPKGFDGKTLNEMLAAGGTIYIKMAGKDGATGDAQFGSQAVKVKIAKQAKAPKAKVDAKKDTIALKNGFDFGFAVKDETTKEYTVEKWFTILPNLKTATVKSYDSSIVATTNYTPLGKKDSNAGKEVESASGNATIKTYSYTAYKFKALSIETILKVFRNESSLNYTNGDCVIAVRKSATEKKPASAASYLELSAQSDKPLVYTQDNVDGEYLVATSADFDKKGIIAGTVVPFPGSVSGEDTIATKGYDDTFEVGKISGSGEIVNADTNGSTYEFAILAQKDLVATGDKAIDVSTIAWKKFDPAKTKITSKLKTKYSLIDGTKTTAQLDTVSAQVNAGSGANTAAQFSGVKNFIVIRRAGNSKSSLRASNWIYLYVVKNGKTYELYSTVDNGEVAYKYTIKFVKYQKNATGNDYSWQASDVEDVSVWTQAGTVKNVKLPETTGAKFYKATAASGDTNAVINGSGSGAITYSASSGYATTGSGENTVEYIAIREYANITVKQEISISGSTTKDVITYYQQKDGKFTMADGTSGEATYFVGDDFTISTSGLPTCTSSSGATVEAGSGEGITFNNGNATVNATTIKTADEVVIVIPYTATPNYKVTFTNATTTYKDGDNDVNVTGTVTVKKGKDDITSGETPVALGTKVTVTVTASSGSKVTSVKINGSAANVSEGVATAEITIDKDTTITITDFVAEKKA